MMSAVSSSERPHVLFVEDDEQIRSFAGAYLEANQFRVSEAPDTRQADELLASNDVDLVIVDRMLPGESGLALCERLHARDMPVIILTAMSQEHERIAGLEAGADDYISKPFSPRELLARIHAVLRRRRNRSTTEPVRAYTFDGWRLDLTTRKLFDPSGARVYLRGAEVMLLQMLCENAGRVLSREEIMRFTHSVSLPNSERSVDLIVSRLRRRIEVDPKDPSLLLTQRSAGYVFSPKVDSE